MTRREEKTLFQVSKLLCIAFLLLAASAVDARPTVTSQDIILTAGPSALDVPAVIPSCINGVAEPIGVELNNLAKEFLQPPASTAGLTGTQTDIAKTLPAIPPAVLMVLTGFLCVSLVKDRRLWLTTLTTLLWAGQTGIQALPQLALRLSYRNHNRQQLGAELGRSYYLENFSRPRCDIEGTRYIALLHHLAGIPDSTTSFLQSRLSFLRKQESRKPIILPCYRSNSPKNANSSQSQLALLSERYTSNSPFNCLASTAKQVIFFSPAFIFQNLARGPPEPA